MKCSHLVNKGWRRDVESVGRKHKTDLKKGLKTNDLKYDIGTHDERYEWEVKIKVKKKKTPNNYILLYNNLAGGSGVLSQDFKESILGDPRMRCWDFV